MIARLQRFYGGDPGRWTRIPLALVRSFSLNVPILQAEDNLTGVQVAQVAGGNMRKGDAESVIRRWSRQAQVRSNVEKPETEEDRIKLMQGAGIQVG